MTRTPALGRQDLGRKSLPSNVAQRFQYGAHDRSDVGDYNRPEGGHRNPLGAAPGGAGMDIAPSTTWPNPEKYKQIQTHMH